VSFIGLKTMASESCCKAGRPVDAPYEGNGSIVTLEDMDMYVADPTSESNKAIVLMYDIFGFGAPPTNGNVRRVADQLASDGFLVVMPDFYRGNPWSLENFPPPDKEAFGAWWSTTASLEVVQSTLQSLVLPYLQDRGVESTGVIGFCWGGLMATSMSGENSPFSGMVSIHGARLTGELAEQMTIPGCFLPASDDPSIEPVREVLDQKAFGDRCVYQTFENQTHGFVAARGDWANDEACYHDAMEALTIATNFFRDVL
jgi:dienelactone hydrolase